MRDVPGVECHLNNLLNAFDILENLVVPEAKYPEPLCFKPTGALCIVCGLFHMLPAIQLHDQFRFETNEIDNIFSDRCLLAKPEPVNP